MDVSLRRRFPASSPAASGAGWQFGVGRYRGDELCWYRLASMRPGPTLVIEYAPQNGVDHIQTIYRDPTNDYGTKFTRK